MPQKMETPAQRIEKVIKDFYAKFLKTPFVIPVAIALATAVYMLVVVYMSGFCLSGLITPLAMLGIFWKLGTKDVKRLLILGAIACIAFSVAIGIYLPYSWMNLGDPLVESDDGRFTEGTVTPMHGTASTAYNFTVTVNWTNLSYAQDVRLIVAGVGYFGEPEINVSMIMAPSTDPDSTSRQYYLETVVPNSMNIFIFGTVFRGNWTEVGELGPVTNEAGAIVASIMPAAFMSVFAGVLPIYALLLLMVWWTRRARRMRTEAYEKAIAEREKERAGVDKDEAKVPSLAKAMGTDKDEGFVCSECGADVPADAKTCPKCGEKFD